MTIISAEEFVRLRTSEDPELYMRAGKDSASGEVWLEVVEKYPEMRVWVARNYTVPVEILRMLLRDPDRLVRHAVAMKKNLTQDMFEELARDPDDLVKQGLLDSRYTPLSAIQVLANDEDERIASQAKKQMEMRGKT
jgi:hypothetical protein